MAVRFKYLGTFIDSKLTFAGNVENIFLKAMRRLHLIRRLQHFEVHSQHILELVYNNLVESVVCFIMIMWYGLLPVKEKQKLGRVVKIASPIVGQQQPQRQLNDIYQTRVKQKAQVIIEDCSHPLNIKFQLLPSKRRFRQHQVRKTVYQM